MKHIIKVNDIQEAKDNPTRPLIAMDSNGILFAEGKAAGPQIEFVDLGLSVKWGNALIGATNGDTAESWYGNYYAWGETETKNDYSLSTYKYANGAVDKLTKYCNDSKFGNNGYTDELTQLLPEDDVATVTNPAWRMPTKDELDELTELRSQWVTNYNGISGLNGRVFTGNNGNTLFIPAAGSREGSDITRVGSVCILWSSTFILPIPFCGQRLWIDSASMDTLNFNERFFGFSVCPVC